MEDIKHKTLDRYYEVEPLLSLNAYDIKDLKEVGREILTKLRNYKMMKDITLIDFFKSKYHSYVVGAALMRLIQIRKIKLIEGKYTSIL